MFAHAVPASPAVSTSTSTTPTGPPSRPSRLRGLSYLRNYTQHHLSLHSQQQAASGPPSQRQNLVRSTSYPPQVSSTHTSPSNPASPAEEHNTFIASNESANSNHNPNPNPNPISTPIPNPTSNLNPSVISRLLSGERSSSKSHQSNTGADPDNSRGMARNRSGASQSASQTGASRRGQSAPPENPAVPSTRDTNASETNGSNVAATPNESSGLAGLPQDQMPTIKFIPHQDVRSGRPSLSFVATSRTLPHEDCVIRVGRYSERDGYPNPPPGTPSSAPVGFKSKVVSRRHCEFWCSQGQWYVKDVKSSSGTFLNHIRLSQPSVESRPFPVNDGDVVQLGIDFRGGEEMIFRCVKIRIECNRAWQRAPNPFNVTTHKRLRALNSANPKKDSDAASTHSSECAICLMSIAPCQSLFVAPCSHVWHYKCIRPMLEDHNKWPQFMCPNCRAMTDLEADIDDPTEEWDDGDADGASSQEGTEIPALNITRTRTDEQQAVDAMEIDDLADDTGHLSITNFDGVNNTPAGHSTLPITPHFQSRRKASQPSPGSRNVTPPTIIEGLVREGNLHDLEPNPWDRASIVDHVYSTAAGRLSPDRRAGTPSTLDHLNHEGPLTPRNDAGPFVFDGSGGRSTARRMVHGSEVTDRTAVPDA